MTKAKGGRWGSYHNDDPSAFAWIKEKTEHAIVQETFWGLLWWAHVSDPRPIFEPGRAPRKTRERYFVSLTKAKAWAEAQLDDFDEEGYLE